MKIVIRLIALFMILNFSISISAYDFEVDGIYYNIVSVSDLTCEVTNGDKKYEGDIKIPREVKYGAYTLSVTNIGYAAFWKCSMLKSIEAPYVTSIGEYAFNQCSALTSVDLQNVTSIGEKAFYICKALKSVDIPHVTAIGSSAFNGCSALTSVDLSKVIELGESAFSSCSALTSPINIPNITSLNYATFSYCPSLTSVSLPNVTSIGASAFNLCYALTSVDLPNVTSIGSNAFYRCKTLNSVDIPNVTAIGSSAFEGCSELTSFDLSKVIELGEEAFKGCSALTSLNLPNVTTIGDNAFRDCTSLESIYFPKLTSINAGLFYGCKSIKSLTVPGSVDMIIQMDLSDWPDKTKVSTFNGCSFSELKFEYGEEILNSEALACYDVYRKVGFYTHISSYSYDYHTPVYIKGDYLPVEKLYIDRKFDSSLFLHFENLKELTLGEHVTSIKVNTPSETIICLGSTPIEISDTYFTNIEYLNLIVKVPKDALEAYRNAPGWKNFWNLQALEDSGVDNIAIGEDVTEVGRYDLSGRAVTESYKGVVIVRYSDGSTKKIMAK